MRWAIYTRVSTAEQGRHVTALERHGAILEVRLKTAEDGA